MSRFATRRDFSAEAHRRCWLDLLRPFDTFHPGAAGAIYLDQPNPAGWQIFDDTLEVLKTLAAGDTPVGVVSDVGWDLRPVFMHFEADQFVTNLGAFLRARHGEARSAFVRARLQGFGGGAKPDTDGRRFGRERRWLGTGGLTALTLTSYSGTVERGLRSALKLVGGVKGFGSCPARNQADIECPPIDVAARMGL